MDPYSVNGLNQYCYCGNDPVNYVDPSGSSAILIGLIVGAIVGAGLGFGTVVYTDHQDDGQIFNGSVKWYEYAGGTLTGAVLGAGVGGIIGVGGATLTAAIASTTNKFAADIFAYALTGTKLGTWEDYAVAFISGGLLKHAGIGKMFRSIYDIGAGPLVNQIVKIGTNRQDSIVFEKYTYNVITRGISSFAPASWKPLLRGLFRSIWDFI